MPQIRVFYNGTTVTAKEHRIDEIYTEANKPPRQAADSWIVVADTELVDASGVLPFGALEVQAGALTINTVERDRVRQRERDRTAGAGGQLDTLRQKLADDTITETETREMLRLERNL